MKPTMIERAARMYHTNRGAAVALGIHMETFARLCRKYGIEAPFERRVRRNRGRKKSEGDEESP